MQPRRLDSILFYGTVLYLISFVFEGPIRLGLLLLQWEQLLYVRELVPALAIFRMLVASREDSVPEFRYFLIACAIATLLGFVFIHNPKQVLFGLKLFSPVFLGIWLGRSPYKTVLMNSRWVFAVLLVCCAGVILEYFVPLPWKGIEYKVGGVSVVSARTWFLQGGTNRLSGFSRSSFGSAIQIFLMFLATCYQTSSKARQFILGAIAFACIVLTTSKGMILAFLVTVAAGLLIRFSDRRAIALFIPVCLVVAMVAAPIFASSVIEEAKMSKVAYDVLFSIVDRLVHEWPAAMDGVERNGHWLLGAGMGSIGVPVYYFSPAWACPGDNFWVYCYSVFGVAAVALISFLSVLPKLTGLHSREDALFFLAIVGSLTMGLTCNVIEDAFLCIALGSACSHFILKLQASRYAL